jgi:hypothetical protein
MSATSVWAFARSTLRKYAPPRVSNLLHRESEELPQSLSNEQKELPRPVSGEPEQLPREQETEFLHTFAATMRILIDEDEKKKGVDANNDVSEAPWEYVPRGWWLVPFTDGPSVWVGMYNGTYASISNLTLDEWLRHNARVVKYNQWDQYSRIAPCAGQWTPVSGVVPCTRYFWFLLQLTKGQPWFLPGAGAGYFASFLRLALGEDSCIHVSDKRPPPHTFVDHVEKKDFNDVGNSDAFRAGELINCVFEWTPPDDRIMNVDQLAISQCLDIWIPFQLAVLQGRVGYVVLSACASGLYKDQKLWDFCEQHMELVLTVKSFRSRDRTGYWQIMCLFSTNTADCGSHMEICEPPELTSESNM